MNQRILIGLLVGLIPSFARADDLPFKLQLIPTPAKKLHSPLYLTNDGTRRLFIINEIGQVLLMTDGKIQDTPFLDITNFVRYDGDGRDIGLLSIAFHPDFASNGLFYVTYCTRMLNGHATSRPVGQLQLHISEFHADPKSATADASTERLLLSVDKPLPDHNCGQLLFGPDDGYLYFAIGDGGGGNDPGDRAQNPKELFGKMLRIDVNHRDPGLPYSIPKDNPFIGNPNYRPEIWTLGMRCPWRYCFDRKTHEFYAPDVGQDRWEEIDLITKGGNYGWRVLEGLHQNETYPDATLSQGASNIISPIFEYPHPPAPQDKKFGAAAIIGGYVYRGRAIPQLQGQYVFADYPGSWFGTIKYENGKVTSQSLGTKLTFDLEHLVNGNTVTAHVLPQISSFGEDADGEIYACDYSHNMLLKLVPTAKGNSK